uniref:EF-hand domain-containing protein n=1 Tax=Acrobeloides nanus TaxID=290746 RepID=A0A914CRF1_9BILA
MRGGPRYVQLPDHFVDSLRVLFDILDTDKTGYVAYDDICSRWRQLPTTQLPTNFLECVKRITPPNGMLTFERFLAGIRISLLEKRNAYPSKIHRVQSEGKLNGENAHSQNSLDKKRNGPAMGLNGFIIDRKPQIYQSQPALVYSSIPPPPPNGYMNGHSPKDEQYSVVLRPKKVESLRNGHIPPAPPLPTSLNSNNINNSHPYSNMKDVQNVQSTHTRFRPISSNSVASN